MSTKSVKKITDLFCEREIVKKLFSLLWLLTIVLTNYEAVKVNYGFSQILEHAIEKFIKTLQAEGKPVTEVEIDQFYGICYFYFLPLLLAIFPNPLILEAL